LTLAELQAVACEAGLPRFVGKQLCEWLYKHRVTSFDLMTNISQKARERLKENYCIGRTEPAAEAVSVDGTRKYLFPVTISGQQSAISGQQSAVSSQPVSQPLPAAKPTQQPVAQATPQPVKPQAAPVQAAAKPAAPATPQGLPTIPQMPNIPTIPSFGQSTTPTASQPVATPTPAAPQPAQQRNAPFTADQLNGAWVGLKTTFKKEQRLIAMLDAHRPTLLDDHTALVTFVNPWQEEEFKHFSRQILTELHNALNNDMLQLRTVVSEAVVTTRAYTAEEKYKLLLEMNPYLGEFKKRFNMLLE